MVFRLEVKTGRRAPATFFTIECFVSADGNALVRKIRECRKKFVHALFRFITHTIKLCDTIFQLAYCAPSLVRLVALAFLHQGANLAAGRVALSVERIGFSNHAPSLNVSLREIVKRGGRKLPRLKCGTNFIKVVADEV